MNDYTRRTCCECGVKKPQPEMVRTERYVETGKSKSGVSGATWAGVLFGNKKSYSSVNRWLFNTSQRNYKRKKEVWLCTSCAGMGSKLSTVKGKSLVKKIGLGLLAFWILVIVIDDMTSTKTPKQNNTTISSP